MAIFQEGLDFGAECVYNKRRRKSLRNIDFLLYIIHYFFSICKFFPENEGKNRKFFSRNSALFLKKPALCPFLWI